MFYIDREGKKTTQKNVFSHETIDIIDNPMFEKVYRQYFKTKSKEIMKEGNILVAYNTYINDKWDLSNFLQYKPLTPMDIIRGVYYSFMTLTHFTNAYRYDHILHRDDRYYRYDVIKNALNVNHKDWTSKCDRFNYIVYNHII